MEVVFGPYGPPESGFSPPYCGWHSSRNNAVSHRAWAAHRLQEKKEQNIKPHINYLLTNEAYNNIDVTFTLAANLEQH